MYGINDYDLVERLALLSIIIPLLVTAPVDFRHKGTAM